MLIKQVAFNSSFPLGNIIHVYKKNNEKISFDKIFNNFLNINIEITTMVLSNNSEGLILPKKISEKEFLLNIN